MVRKTLGFRKCAAPVNPLLQLGLRLQKALRHWNRVRFALAYLP
jgi:hypothetical protein